MIGCDPGTCPGSSICVEWRPEPERLSQTYCMKSCRNNGGCRSGAGYACLDSDNQDEPRLLLQEGGVYFGVTGDGSLVTADGGVPIAVMRENRVEGRGFCAAVNAQ